MKKIRLVLLGVSIFTVAACSTTRNSAPVVDRAPSVKSVEVPKSRPVEGRGFYTVKRGDTLYRIALEVGQNYRDIVAWNSLATPNDIKVDQVLRVLPPEQGAASTAASSGAQTGSVSAGSGVEVRALSSAPSSAVSTVTASNKIAPRGDKRPYSDAALAELQKPDAITPTIAKVDAPKNAEIRHAEKPVDAPISANADDEAIGWMWPAEGKVIATFDGGKKGIDIAGKLGQPVVAAGSGKIIYASSVRGYGNLVIVKHTGNLLSAYAHNKTIVVKEGQAVSKGQKIAEMGNSDTDAVKLHFEIRQQGKPVDPSKFLPTR